VKKGCSVVDSSTVSVLPLVMMADGDVVLWHGGGTSVVGGYDARD
jgi:hypothetical protein